MYAYPIDIGQDDTAVWATSQFIPEFHTQADTMEELHARQAPDGMISALSCYVDLQVRIPVPDRAPSGDGVYLPLLSMAQVRLWNAMCDQSITHEELARRLKVSIAATHKLTDLCADPEIKDIERAVSVMGLRLCLTIQPMEI